MPEIVAEDLIGPSDIEPVHEAGRRVEHRLAAEILPALELRGLGGVHRDECLHRVGVPGVHQRALGRPVVAERAVTGREFRHADVGGVANLAVALHGGLHGRGRRRIGIDGDGVFATERLFDDLGHRGSDLVAIGVDTGGRPADRLALRLRWLR